MPSPGRGGSGTADKPLVRKPQRKCSCGSLIASNKKRMCWDCEGKAVEQRKRLRVKRKAS
jgi:hypothetical protein